MGKINNCEMIELALSKNHQKVVIKFLSIRGSKILKSNLWKLAIFI